MHITMKKTCIIVCILSSFASSLCADSCYRLDLKKDALFLCSATGLNGISYFLDSGPSSLTDIDHINSFDRGLMFDYDQSQDKLSTYLAASMLTLPIISPLMQSDHIKNWMTYGLMYTEAFLLTYGSKELLKSLIPRNRPYSFTGDIPEDERDDYYNSFPSGHTSYAFLAATFLSTTFSQEYPESPWRLPIIIGSYSLATTVGALRISSGNHYITDVLTGAAIGSLYACLIPQLHLANKPNDIVMYIAPQHHSLTLSLNF